jgi:hypothetical protein
MAISKKRMELLVELERIVGNQCYNGNIQNWGPGGSWEGEGREFRYPITYMVDGEKKKYVSDLTPPVAMTGYYAFGANQLHIMKALEKVIERIEEKYGVKF